MTVHDTTKDYAVITGASGELGAKLAHRLLEKGWQVELWSRNRSERINELLSSYVSTAHWQEVDVTDTATIKKALSLRSNGGQLRLLVNNAGLLHQGLFVTEPESTTDQMVNVNLLGLLHVTKACARVMIGKGGGNIINISSINAIRGHRGVASYSAAKAGINGITTSLARELGPEQIRVNTIMPGYFASDLSANVTSRNLERIKRRTPLGRLGTPEDIIGAFDFLTDPSTSFVTAQTIVIDGGLTC